jgi:hypothetical protein
MRRFLMLALFAVLCLAPAGAQVMHGNGAPNTLVPPANCGFSRFYVDDSTQKFYIASLGSPCVWTDPSVVLPATFTAPVFSSWSTLGTGCTNASGASYGGGAAIVVQGQSGTVNTCGVQIAATGTFTRTFVINIAPNLANFSSILVGFTDGTKFESCGIGWNNSLQATAISSATLTGTIAAANGVVAGGYVISSAPSYFRLRSVAGTSLACDYSPDQGQNWLNVFNDTTPFLTVSNVFFGANQRGATGVPFGYLVSYQ